MDSLPAVKQITGLESISPDKVITAFIASQDVKQKSKKTYLGALTQFFNYLDDEDKEYFDLFEEDIIRYKEYLTAEGKSALTVNSYLTAIRIFYRWLESKKICPNIAKGIKGTKKPRGFKKDSLTPYQAVMLLNSIERDSLGGLRDFALLYTLLTTAVRESALVNANVEDLRQSGGEALLYIQLKGGDSKDTPALIDEDVLKQIRAYLSERGEVKDDDPLFISLSDRSKGQRLTLRSVSRIVKERLKSVGLDDKRLTGHSLRHTGLTFSLLSGASLQETQNLAGHSDINTTLIYAHNIDRIKNAPERKIVSFLKDNGLYGNNYTIVDIDKG